MAGGGRSITASVGEGLNTAHELHEAGPGVHWVNNYYHVRALGVHTRHRACGDNEEVVGDTGPVEVIIETAVSGVGETADNAWVQQNHCDTGLPHRLVRPSRALCGLLRYPAARLRLLDSKGKLLLADDVLQALRHRQR